MPRSVPHPSENHINVRIQMYGACRTPLFPRGRALPRAYCRSPRPPASQITSRPWTRFSRPSRISMTSAWRSATRTTTASSTTTTSAGTKRADRPAGLPLAADGANAHCTAACPFFCCIIIVFFRTRVDATCRLFNCGGHDALPFVRFARHRILTRRHGSGWWTARRTQHHFPVSTTRTRDVKNGQKSCTERIRSATRSEIG